MIPPTSLFKKYNHGVEVLIISSQSKKLSYGGIDKRPKSSAFHAEVTGSNPVVPIFSLSGWYPVLKLPLSFLKINKRLKRIRSNRPIK